MKVKRMDVVKKNEQWRAESKGRAVPGTSAPPEGRRSQEDLAKRQS